MSTVTSKSVPQKRNARTASRREARAALVREVDGAQAKDEVAVRLARIACDTSDNDKSAREIAQFARQAARDLQRLTGAAIIFASDTETGTPSEHELRRYVGAIARLGASINGTLDAIHCSAKSLAATCGEPKGGL